MIVEGLGENGRIDSFNSIFPGAQLDSREDRVNAPYCAISAVSNRRVPPAPLRQKYLPPSSQPSHPRSHYLSVTQPRPYLATSSLYLEVDVWGWRGCFRRDRACGGECLWSPSSSCGQLSVPTGDGRNSLQLAGGHLVPSLGEGYE